MHRSMVPRAFKALFILVCVNRAIAFAEEPVRKWELSTASHEASFFTPVDPDARIYVNAPLDADGKPAHATRLVIFALPNGNTIEWTLGSKMAEGMDWHYDIQHVLAQVRAYRELRAG